MRSRWLDVVILAYAVLLIAAGVHAMMDHNTVGLITRCVSGIVVLGLAAYGRVNARVGRIGIAVFALIIALHTAEEYFVKHRGPASLILCLGSFAVVACLLSGHFMAMKKLKETA